MSFGFSIGDLITVIQLGNKIRGVFVDAPKQFKAISDEVRSLSIILQDIQIQYSNDDLRNEQKTQLTEIVYGCQNVLQKLEETLQKYNELKPGPAGVGGKVKRAWKRLQWEPEDIKELRSRISTSIGLLNTFIGRLTQDNVSTLVRNQEQQEGHEILEWLTPIDYALQHNDFISQRQEETGKWLLESPQFQTWVENKQQTLFCPGIPGAGKTILTSIIIDDLTTRFSIDTSVGIAYIYCNFRRQYEQKAENVIAALLKQMIQGQSSLLHIARSLYEKHKDKRTLPSLGELSNALQTAVDTYAKVFILVDALDEIQSRDGQRERLLSAIFNLQSNCQVNLFATSRSIPDITEKFKKSLTLEIRAANEDVGRYLEGHMFKLPRFVNQNPELREEIKNEILSLVDGMFLLAQLHLDSLIGKRSPRAIRTALKALPTGSNAYDYAYDDAMNRIEGQVKDQEILAKQALSWITCATRPLTTAELQHALAVEPGDVDLDKEGLVEIEDILSACAGLVRIEEQSEVIRLVHYTTQEYFERTQNYWFPNAEDGITINCVTYLSFNVFESASHLTRDDLEMRLCLYPLYEYAVEFWDHHARKASTLGQSLSQVVLDFLQSEAKIVESAKERRWSSVFRPEEMTALHWAAFFGIDEAMSVLCKKGFKADSKDNEGRTPLMFAAQEGRESSVKWLLAQDHVDINSRDDIGCTPLSYASEYGRLEVVKLLLERDDINADPIGQDGDTPLLFATFQGHMEIAKLLLARNYVNAGHKDSEGLTALLMASIDGDKDVVKLLLARSDVNAGHKDSEGRTALGEACRQGLKDVVKLLLARKDVDINSEDSDGCTPLFLAIESREEEIVKEEIVKLLLARSDIKADHKDSWGRTPLAAASSSGHEGIVKLLLARDDVDINSKDEDGHTPLYNACVRPRKGVVKLLLQRHDIEINSMSEVMKSRSWKSASIDRLIQRDSILVLDLLEAEEEAQKQRRIALDR